MEKDNEPGTYDVAFRTSGVKVNYSDQDTTSARVTGYQTIKTVFSDQKYNEENSRELIGTNNHREFDENAHASPMIDDRLVADAGNEDGLELKPSNMVMSPLGAMRRNFFDRTFSKVEAGSVRGSIFSLCACAIGSGVLSLPYVLALNGYVLGLVFILTGAIAAIWSNDILAKLASDLNMRNLSSLATAAGGKTLERTLSYMILIYMFGSCISYQIIIGQLFKYVCEQLGMDKSWTGDAISGNSLMLSIYQGVPTAFLFLLPLALMKDMSAFRYVSLASIGALAYTGIVLIVELPDYYNYFSSRSSIKAAYWDLNIFTGCSMTFFAYTC